MESGLCSDVASEEQERPEERPAFCARLRVLRTAVLLGAFVLYWLPGPVPAVALWVMLSAYGAVFAMSFFSGCRRDCPESGLLPAYDLAFAVLLAVTSGGLESSFIVACAFVIGLNAFCMGTLRAVLYGSAGALLLVSFHAINGLGNWPNAIATAAFLPAIASALSYLGRSREQANSDRTRLRHELEEDTRQIQRQTTRIEEFRGRLQSVENLASMGRSSAEIVHQVRDPLSAISLNLEMLEEDLEEEGLTSTDVREALGRIEREVVTLGDLAENYLQYARLPTPRRRIAQVNEIVSEVLAQEMPQLARSRVAVCTDFAKDSPVHIDRRQVKYALHNLIDNAREAMPDGGRLKAATALANGSVCIRIGDTGTGISPEDQSHVFDAFFTTKRHGTGLGLSLARKIVEQHGGRLTCTSLAGVGTTFEITFECAAGKDAEE